MNSEENPRPLVPIPTGVTPKGLSKLGREKAMLFDVYGTLVISSAGECSAYEDHENQGAIRDVLRRFEIIKKPEQVRKALRDAITREHARLLKAGIDYPEVDILRIWRSILGWDDSSRIRAFALAYELNINPIYPMPGIWELLRACGLRGLMLGIVSNAQFYTQDLLKGVLTDKLEAWVFDPRLTFYSYQYQRAKPSVHLFEMAARRLLASGIEPGACLFIGNDMRNDVLPAKTVGFQTALFAGDQRSLRWRKDDPRCRDLIPDMVVTDLRQLILKKAGFEGSGFEGG